MVAIREWMASQFRRSRPSGTRVRESAPAGQQPRRCVGRYSNPSLNTKSTIASPTTTVCSAAFALVAPVSSFTVSSAR